MTHFTEIGSDEMYSAMLESECLKALGEDEWKKLCDKRLFRSSFHLLYLVKPYVILQRINQIWAFWIEA